MIKTTTKTNFTKSVKYKVGTVKSIADLLATKAMSEGDLTGLEAVYRSACDQLEKFVMYENGSLTAGIPTFGDTKKISEDDPAGDDKVSTPADILHDREEKSKLAALVDFLYSHPTMEVGDLFDDNGNLNCLGDDVLVNGETKKISKINPHTQGLKEFCEKTYHTSDPDEAARLAAAGVEVDDVSDDDTEKEGSNND